MVAFNDVLEIEIEKLQKIKDFDKKDYTFDKYKIGEKTCGGLGSYISDIKRIKKIIPYKRQ